MKDFLQAGGLEILPLTPRQVIKQAFAAGMIADGPLWIEMLEHRNRASYTYDQLIMDELVAGIGGKYLAAMTALQEFLAGQEAA